MNNNLKTKSKAMYIKSDGFIAPSTALILHLFKVVWLIVNSGMLNSYAFK